MNGRFPVFPEDPKGACGFPTISADGIGIQTLLGGMGRPPFPVSLGNCFGVIAGGKSYRILNMLLENLQELLRQGTVMWPIQIHVLEDGHAVVHDHRIPETWHRQEFCIACCPNHFLPITQRLSTSRKALRGEILIFDGGVRYPMDGGTEGIPVAHLSEITVEESIGISVANLNSISKVKILTHPPPGDEETAT